MEIIGRICEWNWENSSENVLVEVNTLIRKVTRFQDLFIYLFFTARGESLSDAVLLKE